MKNEIIQNNNERDNGLADTGACATPDKCRVTEGRPPVPFVQRALADTAAGMNSPDYKERFKAEYIQTKIRYERLKAFNTRIEAARRAAEFMNFHVVNPPLNTDAKVAMPQHDCPDDLLREQQSVMGEYLHILEVRAVIEGVDLGGC